MKKNSRNFFLSSILFFVISCFDFSFAASERDEWKENKQTHFIVFYKSAPQDFLKNVERSAERYYDQISINLGYTRYQGWTGDKRARIYIHDDAESYAAASGQAHWSHGAASTHEKLIHTYPAAAGFFDSILPHELGHLIFREFIGLTAQIPLWLEEGVAMYQEEAKRWGAHDEVRAAMSNGKFIPLDQLTLMKLDERSDPAVVNLFYTESASVVNYLINELGEQRFVHLCRELKTGRPFEWALDKVYVRFKNIEGLNKAWVKYLTQILQ